MQLKPREDEPNTEGLDSGAVDTESVNVSSEYNGDQRPSNNDFLNDPKPMDDFSDLEEEPYVIGMNGSGVGLNPNSNVNSNGYMNSNGNMNLGGVPGGVSNEEFYDVGNEPERILTKKEFYNKIEFRIFKDQITLSSIFIIIASIYGLLRVQFWLQAMAKQIEFVNDMASQFGMAEQAIDTKAIMNGQIFMTVIMVALALGILFLRSRVCAVSGLVISVVNMIYMVVQYHKLSLTWVMLAFIYATMSTIRMGSEWDDYQRKHGLK